MNPTTPTERLTVSVNVCRPTMRGPARDNPEDWWVIRFLRRFFDLRFEDNPDFLFFGDTGSKAHLDYPASTIRIFTTGENIVPNWNEADYALTHERYADERHFRLPLWRHWYDTTCTKPERNFEVISGRVDRFCNFIYSNEEASERIDFFHRLSKYKHVDSGGKVLNNIGGRVEDKQAMVRASKFTIAFENSSRSGYSTEKIIEPLLCGSIPIYWGDMDIEQDFNPACLINVHNFDTHEQVIERVSEIDHDDDLWRTYVTAPVFKNNSLPELVTDNALVTFFAEVFREGRSRVHHRKKRWQRLTRQIRKIASR